jgi:hypothetical protein
MESDSKVSAKSSARSASEEAKKSSEKAKTYIKSCKEIVHKQSEQLKKQQSEFKAMLSSLETQHFTARFHAVAFKLELEVVKMVGAMRKVRAMALAKGFQRYAVQTKKARIAEGYGMQLTILRVRKAFGTISRLGRGKYEQAMRTAVRIWAGERRARSVGKAKSERIGGNVDQKLAQITSENVELRTKITRLKAKLSSPPQLNIQDLLEENRRLKDKVQVTEQNVGVFIREMGSLLDQHEPSGARAEEEDLAPRPPSKNKKLIRPKIRSRMTTYSPERLEEKTSTRRSIDKRRLQFD